MKLLTKRAKYLWYCVDLPRATQVEDAQWEPFQLAHFNDDGSLRIEDKARQIAWSFTVAAEAVANAALHGESTIFVSINLEEAREKVRYAKKVLESIIVSDPPRLVKDNVLGLEFGNGARILSLPSKPPRGKAKMHIVLDEFAHIQHDRLIYTASLPIITRGGRLRIGSSPLGAEGMHWEISQQELRPYPGYVRVTTPWWKVRAFCKDRILPADAEEFKTEERVDRYGNERMSLIFGNMLLDDFQQEYECTVIDESVSYFTWELIRKNQDETLKHWHVKSASSIAAIIVEIKTAIARSQVESVLVGGVDVGRKKHLTEIMLVGMAARSTPVRLMVSLDRIRFDEQEQCLRHLMQVLPIASLLIDQNGIGMQLAENLGWDTATQGVTFTNASKALWATELKIQMERSRVPLPCDRELAYQIHSIKQKITAAKNVTYDTEANEKHHADKMWALALAVWAAHEYAARPEWGDAPQWQRT